MKQQRALSRRLIPTLWLPMILGAVVLAVGIYIMESHRMEGLLVIAASAVYLLISFLYYEKLEKDLSAQLLAAGFEQSQIQKNLLKELPIPYIITNSNGNQIWFNEAFTRTFSTKGSKKTITQMFPEIYRRIFPEKGAPRSYQVMVDDRRFRVEGICMQLEGLVSDDREKGDIINAFYFFDETELAGYQEEQNKRNLVAGLIYVDNYEEVLENMEEVRQSLLLALVERKILKYMQGFHGIVKKFERDKYLFVMEEGYLDKLTGSRFSILDEVRNTNIGNEMALTLSIGVGVSGKTYEETYESARIAMDLALGRGGDQAVVRDGETISYYGGKTQKVEKSTRVKARVKAHAMRELMLGHDQILIMGHKNPDADCIGAALGIYRLAQTLGKSARIVMDKDCPAIEPIVDNLYRQKGEDEEIFISNEAAKQAKGATTMLVVVDVNVPSMTECQDLLRQIVTIAVLDHHRQKTETIRNAVVSYIEPFASSTCEMVAEILQYSQEKIRLRPIEADALYSGILVDTDNFVIKAGVRTFEAAAYLRRVGADVTRVRKMFREDFEYMQVRSQIISRAEIYMDEFAISTLDGTGLEGATVVGAKAANSLLDIQGIRGSFVLTKLPDCIYISARSIDDINVQIIMEQFDGGGHLTVAAAQLKDTTLEKALATLKEVIKNMRAQGDI